jgi:hypothetical protein
MRAGLHECVADYDGNPPDWGLKRGEFRKWR